MGPTELPLRREPQPEASPEYVSAGVGAALGGCAGAAAGGGIGMAYSSTFMPNAELEGILPIAIGALLLLWVGACLGVFGALRLRKAVAVGPTVAMTAAGIPAWGIVSLPSFFWMIQNSALERAPAAIEVGVPVLILCIPPALAARALILHQKKLADREET